jgi:hypothetical protein
VLHIATVHHRSPRWIEIQTRQLRRHLSVPYQTWTSLEGIDASYEAHFDHIIDQAGGHAGKLNNLATEIAHHAADDDLVMFLDGDAFPIDDPMPLIHSSLAETPLVAVQRAENLGDQQPHPCFCVTSVRTWRKLPGDWSMGHRWRTPDGRRWTDVGGNLLRALELTNTPWTPVHRTNPIRFDALMFAIYGESIYHHGAGFRRLGGASRAHYDSQPRLLPLPDNLPLRMIAMRINGARVTRWKVKTRGPQILESNRLFAKIESDDADWVAAVRG